MVCELCKKEEETQDAFYFGKIIRVCEKCIKSENLTIIKKPTTEQLERADKRFSVRERMMRLSGLDQLSPISQDHEIAQRNIAKIRIPPKRQNSDLLVYNYNWDIMMARRRKKMTLNQLSDLTKIPVLDLQNFEKGILPKDFERIAKILSSVLNISLLKLDIKKKEESLVNNPVKESLDPEEEIRVKLFKEDLEINKRNEEFRNKDNAEEVVNQVDKEVEIEREEFRNKLIEGKFDFSKRDKLRDVTLSDLVEMKKQREKTEKERINKKSEEKQNVLGSDIEILDD